MRAHTNDADRARLLGVMAIPLFLIVVAHAFNVDTFPIWIDEWTTLSPLGRSFISLLTFFSGPGDTPFPLYFLFVKPWYHAALRLGLDVNWAARLGTIALTALIFLCWAAAVYRGRNRALAVLIFSLGLLLLSVDGFYAEHSVSARWYGHMSLLMVACVSLAVCNLAWVAVFGMVIALLHPFGAIIGFPVSLVAVGLLVLENRIENVSAWAARLLAASWLASMAVYAGLVYLKYIGAKTQGLGFGGTKADLVPLVKHLSVPFLLAAVAGVAALGVCLRLRGAQGATWRSSLESRVLLQYGAALLGVLAFLAAAPFVALSIPPYRRYVEWMNIGLLLIGVSTLLLTVRLLAGPSALEHLHRRGRRALPFLAVVPAALALPGFMTRDLGPPDGRGLREAATYIALNAATDAGIASNGQPNVWLPPRFAMGLRCGPSSQIGGYLDATRQGQVLCDDNGRVTFGSLDEVWLVREPVAYIGNRVVDADSLPKLTTLRIFRTVLDVHSRIVPGRNLEIRSDNTIQLPDHSQGTLFLTLRVPAGQEPGRLARTVLVVGEAAAAGIRGRGFAIYHDAAWTATDTPRFALVASHDGAADQYGAKGRAEKYFFEPLSVRDCGDHDLALVGLSWQKDGDGVRVSLGTRLDIRASRWGSQELRGDALGGATVISYPRGSLTSSFPIIKASFVEGFVDGIEPRRLRLLRIIGDGDCS